MLVTFDGKHFREWQPDPTGGGADVYFSRAAVDQLRRDGWQVTVVRCAEEWDPDPFDLEGREADLVDELERNERARLEEIKGG